MTVSWPSHRHLVKVATGKVHSLFLLDSGEVYGCGGSSCGQLGLGASKRAMEDALQPTLLEALSDIRDIAAGAEFSLVCDRERGQVFTFGHPEVTSEFICAWSCMQLIALSVCLSVCSQYGQLGNGSTGESLQEGKRGLQFDYRTSPVMVKSFSSKDLRGGGGARSIPAEDVRVCAVAAGKNHCLCLEDWRTDSEGSEGAIDKSNRVFSWG